MGSLHRLPTGMPATLGDPDSFCRQPGCGALLTQPERGRKRDFCSATCRQAYHRARKAAAQRLTQAQRELARYGLTGPPPDASDSRLVDEDLARYVHAVELATARLDLLTDPAAADIATALRQARRDLYEALVSR